MEIQQHATPWKPCLLCVLLLFALSLPRPLLVRYRTSFLNLSHSEQINYQVNHGGNNTSMCKRNYLLTRYVFTNLHA
jgi:hypothetical protein